jgi:hypothetical protein
MDSFDISAKWVILSPFPVPAPAEDLARRIAALRERDGLGLDIPAILDAAGPAPEDSVPIIVLNMEHASDERGGCTWRIGRGRVEIYGDSRRGLRTGVYSFLAALGLRWPGPGLETLPQAPAVSAGPAESASAGAGIYPLSVPGVYVRSDLSPENRRRLIVPPHVSDREIPALYLWAARNRVDALVFSLRDNRFRRAPRTARRKAAAELLKDWGFIIERGGWDLSFLIPRPYFFFKRDLFRMEGGRRKKAHHFCPTNPQTISLIQLRIAALLKRQKLWYGAGRSGTERDRVEQARAEPQGPGPYPRRIYHLWPDRGAERLWCACPACRAFSPREQIRLAVNTAAALIAKQDPQAFVSCWEKDEDPAEQLPGGSEITPGPNVFTLKAAAASGGESALYIYEHGAIGEL